MKTGIELIAQERKEQIEKGYSIANDIENNLCGQLANVACALIDEVQNNYPHIGNFPAEWDSNQAFKMVQKPYKERLIIAGALIAAELDRLNQDGL